LLEAIWRFSFLYTSK